MTADPREIETTTPEVVSSTEIVQRPDAGTGSLVKIVADSATQKIYGGLIVGYHAVDSLQELALAMKHGLTVQQLGDTIHTHPTFVESIGFAAEAWLAQT